MSSPYTCPFPSSFSNIFDVWPPYPKVASRPFCPGFISRKSRISWTIIEICIPAGVLPLLITFSIVSLYFSGLCSLYFSAKVLGWVPLYLTRRLCVLSWILLSCCWLFSILFSFVWLSWFVLFWVFSYLSVFMFFSLMLFLLSSIFYSLYFLIYFAQYILYFRHLCNFSCICTIRFLLSVFLLSNILESLLFLFLFSIDRNWYFFVPTYQYI